jgi:predicted transposase YbfD/YdcC
MARRCAVLATAHLLSAVLHQEGIVIGQQAVPDKTNEIPGLRTLLTPMDIVDRVVTADAMHAQDDTARFIVEDKQAHYMLQLKANQHSLLADVELLGPVEKGHGCIERRSVSARSALADYLAFPYAQQVIRVERTTWTLGPNVAAEAPLFHEVSFYLSDLTPEQAAARLGRPAPQGSPRDRAQHLAQANTEYLGGLIRGHRGIERHHWVRDRAFREDESQVRRGAASQVMASLRNCAINPIRTLGVPNIAATLRHLGRHPECICTMLGIERRNGFSANPPTFPTPPGLVALAAHRPSLPRLTLHRPSAVYPPVTRMLYLPQSASPSCLMPQPPRTLPLPWSAG